jgi:hypothetical protein
MTNYLPVLLVLFILTNTYQSQAQQLTIQQPVIRQFSAATAVVVPDRGSAFVAGIGRSAYTTKSFGPLYRGSSVGQEVSHGSIQTSVYIHDFEEMDRLLLEQAELESPQYIFRNKSTASTFQSHRQTKTIPSRKTPPSATDIKDEVYSLDQLRQDLKK